MTPTLLAMALSVVSAALLAWRWRRLALASSWSQGLGACVVLTAIVTLWLLAVNAVLGTLSSDWSGARLAATFALTHGYQLYYPATEGPILNHLYGPVAALAYLPVTVFHTPNAATLAAGVLQVSFVFGAMLAFVWRAGGRTAQDSPRALACGLGACLLMARYPGTAYHFTMVHADGPALALGLLACGALVSNDGARPTTRALLLSGAAAVLSCWTKQTSAPLPLALALAVWWMYGRALAVRYALLLAAVAVPISATLLYWFGEPMLFNMVQVASRHPWVKPGLAGLAVTVWILIRDIWEVLALLAIGLVVVFLSRGTQPRGAALPWLPPLLVALFLLPIGALGANKIGGQANSFHSVYYLIAAATALLASAGRHASAARSISWALCLAGILAAWHSGRSEPWTQPPDWANHQQAAYELALRRPGEVYFPWQPLASLLAEGRLYHFEYGLFDRVLGGYPPTPEHLRAHLPPEARWIATSHAAGWTFTLLPEFSEEVHPPELADWKVRARPAPAP